MRGRPKIEDSRNNQYRIRLNDEEEQMLSYVSKKTDRTKSEIFRTALMEYYNKVLLNEIHRDEKSSWEMECISLVRAVKCPACGGLIRIDLADECDQTSTERPMGDDTLYEFDYEETCMLCSCRFRVSGYISEYPAGVLDNEKISLTPIPIEE